MSKSVPKYHAKVLESLQTRPGCWNELRVGVFVNEETPNGAQERLIGEYQRNYSSLYDTFFPFHLNGKDLALYSKDYTCTRIMELPSCKDLGGEEPHGHGFCPVDFYVPSYVDFEMIYDYRAGQKVEPYASTFRVDDPDEGSLNASMEFTDKDKSRRLTGRLYYPFGFVAGCIWGDDSSWKIELLDLSEAHKGILKREQRFGYIELPGELNLKQAIRIYGDPSHEPSITIATESSYDLKTGKKRE